MTNPKHPVYIISKGRSESMLTSRSFARMKVPHYIAIEPQDEELYEEALDKFNIRPYVTLLIAPFTYNSPYFLNTLSLLKNSYI